MGNSDHGTTYVYSIESRLIMRGGGTAKGGATGHSRGTIFATDPGRDHTVDYNPPLKNRVAQRKLTFMPFLLQFWSRTKRITGAPKHS